MSREQGCCFLVRPVLKYVHYCTGPPIASASGPSLIQYNLVFFTQPCFLHASVSISHAVSYIYFSGNQAKCLPSRLFVVLGQYHIEDCVIAWVLRLVLVSITPRFCIWHNYCIYTYTAVGPIRAPYTFRSSFGRPSKSRVWPLSLIHI